MSEHDPNNPHDSTDANQLAPDPGFKESHTRSVLKALSWRIVATTTTILVALFWTGNLNQALAIGGIEFFAKIPVYYFHERGWQMVPRGVVRNLLGKKTT